MQSTRRQSLLVRRPGLTFAVTTGLGGALRPVLRDGRRELVVSRSAPTTSAISDVLPWPWTRSWSPPVPAIRGCTPTRQPPTPAATTGCCRGGASVQHLTDPRPRSAQPAGAARPRRGRHGNDALRCHPRHRPVDFISRHDLCSSDETLLHDVTAPDLSLHRHIGVLTVPSRYLSPAVRTRCYDVPSSGVERRVLKMVS